MKSPCSGYCRLHEYETHEDIVIKRIGHQDADCRGRSCPRLVMDVEATWSRHVGVIKSGTEGKRDHSVIKSLVHMYYLIKQFPINSITEGSSCKLAAHCF